MIKKQLKPGRYSLTREQVLSLILVTDKPLDKLLIGFMGLAGLRREETTKLKFSFPDLNSQRIFVPGKYMKYRQVPMDKILFRMYSDIFYTGDEYKNNGNYIFPSPSKANSPINVYKVNRVVAVAGVKAGIVNPDPDKVHVNPHILRHSYAHYLKSKRIPLEIIRDVLGHSSISTTADTYGLASIDEIQKELESIS